MPQEKPPGIVAVGLVGFMDDYSSTQTYLQPTPLTTKTPMPPPMPPPAWSLSRIAPPPGLSLEYVVISLPDFIGKHRLLNMMMPTTYTIIDGVHPDDLPDTFRHIGTLDAQAWNVIGDYKAHLLHM